MRKLATLLLVSTLSTTVLASPNDTIFSCTISTGKPLSVKKQGDHYLFSYDKTSFQNKVSDVVANTKSFIAEGSGFITSSLELKNKAVSYTIQFSQPRNNLKLVEDIVISVVKGDDVKFLKCNSNKKVLQNFDKSVMRKAGF